MDTYKLKWTRLQNEIIRFLSINSGKTFNQRKIAQELKVSPTAISKSLNLLKKQEIINMEKQGNMNLTSINFNRDSSLAIGLKRADNLKLLYESKIIEFLEEKFPGTTIILFGSYSKGEDTYNSDIDIAIIGTKEKEINTEKFDKILMKEIRVNFYKDWREINKNLKNNILNGITLSGWVEL
tara:strand:- start:952 stop:1497 length:546 start_codon:yes stop_codon:yes gene_type:complete